MASSVGVIPAYQRNEANARFVEMAKKGGDDDEYI
jgi:hypothetical protein